MSNKLKILIKFLAVVNAVYALIYLANIDYMLDGPHNILFTTLYAFALLYIGAFTMMIYELRE